MKNDEKDVRRGDIYYADLGDEPCGSEQGGIRPVLIVQNNVGNKFSPTLIVAPMTSSDKKHRLPTHCAVGNMKKPSLVLTEQLRTIDRARLRSSRVQSLSEDEMDQVNKALSISIGLEENVKSE